MKVTLEEADLAPIIEKALLRALEHLEADSVKLGDRLAFTEPEAAAQLGVRPHVLRDARLRGEIEGARVGKRIVYTREQLVKFLQKSQSRRES